MRVLYQNNLNVLFWQVYLCLKLCLPPVLHYPTSAMLSLKYCQINSKTILVLGNKLRFFSYKTEHAHPLHFGGGRGGGGLKNSEKSLLGGGGRVRNFCFGGGGVILLGGSCNFEIKIKTA